METRWRLLIMALAVSSRLRPRTAPATVVDPYLDTGRGDGRILLPAAVGLQPDRARNPVRYGYYGTVRNWSITDPWGELKKPHDASRCKTRDSAT